MCSVVYHSFYNDFYIYKDDSCFRFKVFLIARPVYFIMTIFRMSVCYCVGCRALQSTYVFLYLLHISKPYILSLRNFRYMLPVAMVLSSFDDSALCSFVVLWITSCLHINSSRVDADRRMLKAWFWCNHKFGLVHSYSLGGSTAV